MTAEQAVEITFHRDGMDEAHPSVNIKGYTWPDLGGDFTEIDQQHIFDRVQEDWHERAAGVAQAHGYSGCFTEGRSSGWLVPFRQIDASGQLQLYGGEFQQWTGQGRDKGYPEYPDVAQNRDERKTFVDFRADIEAMLEQVPDMARDIADCYREDKELALAEAARVDAEATRRDAIVETADERDGERRDAVDALKGVGHHVNDERFDVIGTMVRADWHEPDEQGIEAFVFGRLLDNAFGSFLSPDEPESTAEIVIVLTENGNPYCTRNLATVLSEAAAYRRAVNSRKLAPSDVGGPSL